MSLAPKEFRYVRGATPDEIGVTLADLARTVPADQAIVELGVYQARTTLLMAWGAREGNGAHVWGVDAWDLDANTYGPPFKTQDSKSWAEHNVRATGYSDQVTLIQGFSVDQAAEWSGPPIGLLFVDDDHSYEGARDAILSWASHLAPGAIIAVDDYGHPDWPGVAQAVDELVDKGGLEPLQIFHDRLAVTKLTNMGEVLAILHEANQQEPDPREVDNEPPVPMVAITSEGVSPSPVAAGVAETVPFQATESSILQPTDEATRRGYVQPGELEGILPATPIEDLNLVNLKALAKARGIVLGARKDLRDTILQALRDGR